MITSRLSPLVNAQNLIPGIVLLAITTVLLFVGWRAGTTSELSQLLVVISGMTTMAALSAFAQSWQAREHQKSRPQSYDYFFSNKNLDKVLAAATLTIQAQTVQPNALDPWDMSPNQFVGSDNSLALAKLRIEIERELRRIAYKNHIEISPHSLGVMFLAQELIDNKILPLPFLEVIRELTSVCNQAIHGFEISNELATFVVVTGGQLIEQLSLINTPNQPEFGESIIKS